MAMTPESMSLGTRLKWTECQPLPCEVKQALWEWLLSFAGGL